MQEGLEEPRVLLLHGDVTEELAQEFMEGLIALRALDPVREITVYLDTYGGSPYSMFAMHDMMRYVGCPIHTVGVGKVMSSGVLLLAAGDKRSIMPNSFVMMHQVSSGLYGKTSTMEVELTHLYDVQDRTYDLYAKYTGRSREEIDRYLADSHDKFMTAEQAKEFGLVDDIVTFHKDGPSMRPSANASPG